MPACFLNTFTHMSHKELAQGWMVRVQAQSTLSNAAALAASMAGSEEELQLLTEYTVGLMTFQQASCLAGRHVKPSLLLIAVAFVAFIAFQISMSSAPKSTICCDSVFRWFACNTLSASTNLPTCQLIKRRLTKHGSNAQIYKSCRTTLPSFYSFSFQSIMHCTNVYIF